VVAHGTNTAALDLPRSTMLAAVLTAAVIMVPALLISAASDRYGRGVTYMVGATLLGIWGFVLFPLIETRSFLWMAVSVEHAQLPPSSRASSVATVRADDDCCAVVGALQ